MNLNATILIQLGGILISITATAFDEIGTIRNWISLRAMEICIWQASSSLTRHINMSNRP